MDFPFFPVGVRVPISGVPTGSVISTKEVVAAIAGSVTLAAVAVTSGARTIEHLRFLIYGFRSKLVLLFIASGSD